MNGCVNRMRVDLLLWLLKLLGFVAVGRSQLEQDVCLGPGNPKPLDLRAQVPFMLDQLSFTRLSGGLWCSPRTLAPFGCRSQLLPELPDRPRGSVLGLFLRDDYNRTILPSSAVDGYWNYGTSGEWYSIHSYQDGDLLEWTLRQPINVSGAVWLHMAMPVSHTGDTQRVCLRVQLNPRKLTRSPGLLLETIQPKWLPIDVLRPGLMGGCPATVSTSKLWRCSDVQIDRAHYFEQIYLTSNWRSELQLCNTTLQPETLYKRPIPEVEISPAEPHLDSSVIGSSTDWLGQIQQGSWLPDGGLVSSQSVSSFAVTRLPRIAAFRSSTVPTSAVEVGAGYCDWHYQLVSALNLEECAQACRDEPDCVQFSYPQHGCRISKCGSDPGPAACPGDKQCPIAGFNGKVYKLEVLPGDVYLIVTL